MKGYKKRKALQSKALKGFKKPMKS